MTSVEGKRVEKLSVSDPKPGEFEWTGEPATYLLFACPCGCKAILGAKVRNDGHQGPVWSWNGDLEKPTLTPSIRYLSGCGWHGYLTAGVFRSC